MSEEIVMPRLSDTMQEGTIARWVKHEGDEVKTGDVLMEVETDKATLELNAYHDGTLAKILLGDGGTAPVGTVVGILTAPGESLPAQGAGGASNGAAGAAPAAPPAGAPPAGAGPDSRPAPTGAPPADEARAAQTPAPAQPRASAAGAPPAVTGAPAAPAPAAEPGAAEAPLAAPPVAPTAEDVKASPLARVMAEAQGLDLRTLAGQGSGPSGRIVRADVEALARRGAAPPAAPAAPAAAPPGAAPQPAPPPAAPAPAPGAEYEDRPLSRLRAGIARTIGLAKPGIPHIYLTIEVEMDAALALRRQLNEAVGDDARAHLTVNDLVIKGAALALRKYPDLNAWYHSDQPPTVRAFRRINVGIAVPVEGGLMVPVLRDADRKTLGAIAAETKDIYDRVRANKPHPDEYTGGTFTVSNLGAYGIEAFQAVINPPQAGILAVGTAAPQAVVRDGQVAVRTVMHVTLSSDHRVVDGVYSAQYLQEFKRLMEAPLTLVM